MPHGKNGAQARRNEAARDEVERRRLVADLHLRLGRMTVAELRRVLLVVAQVERERAS
jgi:hypothetical protein